MQGSLKNNKKLSQFKCVLPERATFWGYTSELAAYRIDHIYYNDKLELKDVKVVETDLSDHNILIADFGLVGIR